MTHFYHPRLACCLAFLLLVFSACDSGTAPTLYDPDRPSDPDPAINSVEPEGAALAGVDLVTISGTNFSDNPEHNYVYFDEVRATLVESSPTRLVVQAPNAPRVGMDLKVSVVGAENFSNVIDYRLDPAQVRFSDIKDFEEPFALATDSNGNLYASFFSSDVSAGIIQITPDGERAPFINTTFKWEDLEFDNADNLYAVRNLRAVFRFPTGGGARQNFAVISDRNVRLQTLDFDGSGNLWTAGSSTSDSDPISIYKVDASGSVTEYPLANLPNTIAITSIAIIGDTLYASVNDDGTFTIMQFSIAGGDLATPGTVYYAYSDEAGNSTRIFDMAVAQNGDLFVGTNATDPILVVTPNGTAAPLYPGVLSPAATYFAWGNAPFLYVTQGSVQGADGPTQPDLIRVNTRREGVR